MQITLLNQYSTIQYRNAKYQGSLINNIRNGIGILLDDNMKFYCSQWKQNLLNGKTLIYTNHAKYFYGQWSKGHPQGINIFRYKDIIMLANYTNGIIEGEFLVIYENKKLIMTLEKNQDQFVLKDRCEFNTYDQIKKMAKKLKFKNSIPKQYFSLIAFIKEFFVQNESNLKLSTNNNIYFFGYLQGLAIIFDNDHFIHRVGQTSQDGKMLGIGAIYKNGKNQQGNFSSNSIIKYKSQRPSGKILKLLNLQHKKSLHFQNDFIKFASSNILTELQKLLQQVIIPLISQNDDALDSQRSYTQNQVVIQSEKIDDKGQNLRNIKQHLQKQIGRPGVSIKPSNQQKFKTEIKNTNKLYSDIPQIYKSPSKIANQLKFTQDSNGLINKHNFLNQNNLRNYTTPPPLQNSKSRKLLFNQSNQKSNIQMLFPQKPPTLIRNSPDKFKKQNESISKTTQSTQKSNKRFNYLNSEKDNQKYDEIPKQRLEQRRLNINEIKPTKINNQSQNKSYKKTFTNQKLSNISQESGVNPEQKIETLEKTNNDFKPIQRIYDHKKKLLSDKKYK